MSENLPNFLPPRDFRSAISRWIYYFSSPPMVIVAFIYFWAFIYMAWFGTVYTKQEIWRNNAHFLSGQIMDIDKPNPYNGDSYTHFLIRYNDKGEDKEHKLTVFAVRRTYNVGGELPLLVGTDGVLRLDEPWQFYRLGLPLVLLLFWLGLPILAANYYLRPRKNALRLFQIGLLTEAALEKEEKSGLSSAEKQRRLYTFSYQTFQDETHTIKVTAKPNQWRKDNKNTALLLYAFRDTDDALIIDSVESAPKIKENGQLQPQFSTNTITALLLAVFASAFISYIIALNS
jgi:hypothetical protein